MTTNLMSAALLLGSTLATAAVAQSPTRPPVTPAPEATGVSKDQRTFGVRRATSADVPTFYVIPMKGQMGTDVNADLYREMLDDIRAVDPDVLVIEVECRDMEDRTVNRVAENERNLLEIDMYRDIVRFFHAEMRDLPQAVWIRDSLGVSSIVALSWDKIFMQPNARLGGLGVWRATFQGAQGDANMYGKLREAWLAMLRGFVEYGDLDINVVDAMVMPDKKLSATWRGRTVEWALSEDGEYLVDGSDKGTVNFSAKTAEDFVLSDGIAETLDDVALLLGYREYTLAPSKAEKIFEDHREGWRKSLEQCTEWLRDADQFLGWANGDDEGRYLGQAKRSLERVLSAMDRYKAVETRLAMEGLSRFDLVTRIEMLKERIRALQQGGSGGGGGGGGGGRRGGGMGGG